MSTRAINLITKLAIPVGLLITGLDYSMYDVQGGMRGVIFDRISGVKKNVIGEGTHFLIPWLQRAIIFDVRTKPKSIATTTGTKDLSDGVFDFEVTA